MTIHLPITFMRSRRVHSADGFLVGRVVRIATGTTARPATRWAARCSPLAFDPTGMQKVARELWAPVPGSDYLPGRHLTQKAAHAELEAYLIRHRAAGLGDALPPNFTPTPEKPECPSCVALKTELARVRDELNRELALRTLGGTPPPVDKEWGNRKLPPPPSASDDRMPAHRRVGMARSDDRIQT